LTDLLTLSLGLSVGGCDEQGEQEAQSLHTFGPLFCSNKIGFYPMLRARAEEQYRNRRGHRPNEKLAQLGVARVSYGALPYIELMGALRREAGKLFS